MALGPKIFLAGQQAQSARNGVRARKEAQGAKNGKGQGRVGQGWEGGALVVQGPGAG